VYLGEQVGLEVGLTCALREPCTKVVLRVESAADGGRPEEVFSNASAPWGELAPGQRVSRAVHLGVRSASPHAVTLTAWLTTAAGDVLSHATRWPFVARVPLGLRTKVRNVPCPAERAPATGAGAPGHPYTLLEVRVENSTDGPLRVSPAVAPAAPSVELSALALPGDAGGGGGGGGGGPWRREAAGAPCRAPETELQAGGGSVHWVFRALGVDPGTGAVGRLEVEWATAGGQRGRLQTQAVSPPASTGAAGAGVGVGVAGLPASAPALAPFPVRVAVTNAGGSAGGPFRVQMPAAGGGDGAAAGTGRAVVAAGPLSHTVPALPPGGSHEIEASFVGLVPGTQKVSGVMLYDAGSRWLATLAPVEILITDPEGAGP